MSVLVFLALISPCCCGCEPVADEENEVVDVADEADVGDEKEAEGRVIPLEEIWAWKMPGTKPVRDLIARKEQVRIIPEIRQQLKFDSEREEPRTGFVVLGTGLDALKEMHRVMTTDEPHKDTFSEQDTLSLAFLSFESDRFVYLREVRQIENEIRIEYQLIPHETANVTKHFAIIPLGRLPAGDYEVVIERLPLEKKYVQAGYAQFAPEVADQLVCRSFWFIVEK